jgi:pyruvate, orthophosphate dikinase
MSAERFVYGFAAGKADGDSAMRDLLGGKGANLAEMCNLGLPVPPGFTITTQACVRYYAHNRQYPDGLREQVVAALSALEAESGKRFGDPASPLLVSVRSGARASMPGMMDTVLNLGLNDEAAAGLAALSGDKRFAFDCYRRFITMYSNVVLDVPHHDFEHILDIYKDERDYRLDTDMTAEDWVEIVGRYKAVVLEKTLAPFPTDPQAQLWGAVGAVFDSWMNKRAIEYRRLYEIPESWGTAVNVQAMVFGNMGETSATGVAFTRDPSTGAQRFYGEYLINAQGEDVVAGIRTPKPITRIAREEAGEAGLSLEEALPDVFQQLVAVYQRLEAHYRDMQDIEFTVERGTLYMLQTRTGKRTTPAALKIAVDMAAEGLITKAEAVSRIDPNSLDQLMHPTIAKEWVRTVLFSGLRASPGAAVGKVVFDSDEAVDMALRGEDVILVRDETSPEDIHGMHAARAIVTARGGLTSHAAVVARGMGRPCVCGATEMRIDAEAGQFTARGRTIKRGEVITVDGSSGEVMFGAAEMIQPQLTGDFAMIMEWADGLRRLKVRANADSPADAAQARAFGAEGIGLCRTEHMFFDAERIAAVREMILASTREDRVAALTRILPMQQSDFEGIFTVMGGLPCTIRLLDPPLHEFLPHTEADVKAVAQSTGLDAKVLLARSRELAEVNPMLGFRGCRLAIAFPEIYEMQTRAIFQAALAVSKATGEAPTPEIMVPFVISKKELSIIRARIDAVAKDVFAAQGASIAYSVGTMIELPRAALRAGEIAEEAEFFSFGTNDLTQSTLGVSRDDAGKFLPAYVEQGVFVKDPFVSIDLSGVGEMIEIAATRGRAVRAGLKLGICGEHGGDPASVAFCEATGLDYVSCSPFRVPIARLAAAQAAIHGAKGSGQH